MAARQLGNMLVGSRQAGAPIDENNGGIRLLKRPDRLLGHPLIDTALTTRDAARIDDDVGDRSETPETVFTIPGQPRIVGNEGVPRAGQSIEQRGLADIGSTYKRDDRQHDPVSAD